MSTLDEPLLRSLPSQRMLRLRSKCIIVTLLVANCIVLGTLLLTGIQFPMIIGPGVLAYSFGLRHAVDADHIAAIDNVTRKLICEQKPSLLVGLYFSLGHSSVVALMTLLAMASSSFVKEHLENAGAAIIGTLLSASLLFLIGSLNLVSAVEILRSRWRRRLSDESATSCLAEVAATESVAVGGVAAPGVPDVLLRTAPAAKTAHPGENGAGDDTSDRAYVEFGGVVETPVSQPVGGVITRCCPAVFNAVNSEARMYCVGFLFGLGFETSSEVALLALATMAPSEGTPMLCTLLLPALFAAGMSLIDTIDGVMMFWAYAWSSSQPGGRDCYNLFLALASSAIAIGIGVIEVVGCLQHELELEGGFWDGIEFINDNFEYVGYSIILFFALSGTVAVSVWALRRQSARSHLK